MSAVILPFPPRDGRHAMDCALAVMIRAQDLGYSRTASRALALVAKREASPWETPTECALRIVRPRRMSATVPDGAA